MTELQIVVFIIVFYLSCVYHFTPKPGTFSSANLCVKCDGQLDNKERMYNLGVCPLCGFKHRSAVTVVETYYRAFRWGPRQYIPWRNRSITWTESVEDAKARFQEREKRYA